MTKLSRTREQELDARWQKDYRAALVEAERGRAENRARARRLFEVADGLRHKAVPAKSADIAAVMAVYLG